MGIDPTYGQVIHLPHAPVRAPEPRVGQVALQEVQAAFAGDIAVAGFILAALRRSARPVLWVQDRVSRRERGRLYLPGGGKRMAFSALLQIEVSHARDVLWAMEEGASCSGLGAVVGEIDGNPKALDFTATKRLALRAEASGVPVWLIRSHDAAGLSAARERWRIRSAPSMRAPHDPGAPGPPCWQVELFRARGRPPGKWVMRHDFAQDRLDLVSEAGDGAVAGDDPLRQDVTRA
ncbi:ImuA family protein [Pontivivens nitratireducens]|nr:hypothetical protein [Pontibrevibacter nitratireducens]